LWESAVATVRWRGNTLDEVTLHPISLGFGIARAPSAAGRRSPI
jgi:hypothetical protein